VNKRKIGNKYECAGRRYLESIGYEWVGSNLHTPYGEIDLLMRLGGTYFYVEVKYRAVDKYGTPREAITPLKISHMKKAAFSYAHTSGLTGSRLQLSFLGIVPLDNGLSFDFIENILSS
jgi:putative endonuclease